MCVCACVRVRVRVCACVRACVCARACACIRTRHACDVCAHVRVCFCKRAHPSTTSSMPSAWSTTPAAWGRCAAAPASAGRAARGARGGRRCRPAAVGLAGAAGSQVPSTRALPRLAGRTLRLRPRRHRPVAPWVAVRTHPQDGLQAGLVHRPRGPLPAPLYRYAVSLGHVELLGGGARTGRGGMYVCVCACACACACASVCVFACGIRHNEG
jgi:hypothetical protein